MVVTNSGASANVQNQQFERRIINGRRANIDAFPVTAAIISEDELQCTGVIIGSKWVLTAAHCYDP
jgi:secreted trypsin-like serine protease